MSKSEYILPDDTWVDCPTNGCYEHLSVGQWDYDYVRGKTTHTFHCSQCGGNFTFEAKQIVVLQLKEE